MTLAPLAAGLVGVVLAILRRRLHALLAPRLDLYPRLAPAYPPPVPLPPAPLAMRAWAGLPVQWWQALRALLAAGPFGLWGSLLLLALVPLAVWAFAVWPAWVEVLLDAPIAAMIALAFAIPPLTIALSLLSRLPVPWRNPVGCALLLALLFATAPPDVYKIRVTDIRDAGAPTAVALRPTLGPALADWIDQCFPGATRIPAVIVAAEGAATRSALWTLSAMRFLDTRTEHAFGKHLFAISGVSGGSLGAATYLHMLRHAGRDCTEGLAWQAPAGLALAPGDPLKLLAETDLRAPSIATFFLADTLRRLLPIDALWHGAPSRAVALEQSFERYWRRAMPVAGDEPIGLLRLRGNNAKLPHLVLNGTDATLGRRLITATFRFDPGDDIFGDSDDLLAILGDDVPLATAVTNSARFPYISPAGDIGPANGRDVRRQVIDGGYSKITAWPAHWNWRARWSAPRRWASRWCRSSS